MTAIFALLYGQSVLNGQAMQKISFETSEGFELGALHEQQGWESYGTANDSVLIVSTLFSDGEQAVELLANANFDFKGFHKNLTENYPITKYSFDVYIDNADWSETFFDILDKNLDTNFSINLSMGGDIWTGKNGMLEQVNGVNFNGQQWNNLSFLVNSITQKVELFFETTSLGVFSLSPNFEVNQFDFYNFDLGSNFAVDNIQIEEIPNLGTQDLWTNSINIYPNPVSDYLTIETNETILAYEIYHLNGQLVQKGKDKKVNVHSLSKGNYILKVKTDQQVFNKKFIKK